MTLTERLAKGIVTKGVGSAISNLGTPPRTPEEQLQALYTQQSAVQMDPSRTPQEKMQTVRDISKQIVELRNKTGAQAPAEAPEYKPSAGQQMLQNVAQDFSKSSGIAIEELRPENAARLALGVPANIVRGAGNLLTGLVRLPQMIISGAQRPETIAPSLEQAGKAAALNINELLGNVYNPETGQLQAPSLGTTLGHIYKQPLETALDVQGATSLAKQAGARMGVGAAQEAGKTGAEQTARMSTMRGAAINKMGIVVDAQDAVRNAEIVDQAVNLTRAKTVYGMVDDLKNVVKNNAEDLDTIGKQLDATQPKLNAGQTAIDINNAVINSDAGALLATSKGGKSLLQRVQGEVRALIEDPANATPGDVGASYQRLNQARIQLNKNISDNWFANGKPLATDADKLNAARWEASTAIKRTMANRAIEAGMPQYQRLLDEQSVAIQSIPAFSQASMKPISSVQGLLGEATPEMIRQTGKLEQVAGGVKSGVETVKGAGKKMTALPPIASEIGRQTTQELQAPAMATAENLQEPEFYQLPVQTAPTQQYYTFEQFRNDTQNTTPGTPEYQRAEQLYKESQTRAAQNITPSQQTFMTGAPSAMDAAKEVNSATSFASPSIANRIKSFLEFNKITDPNMRDYARKAAGFNLYFSAAYKQVLGQEAPEELQLSVGDTPQQAQEKLEQMVQQIKSWYQTYQQPFLALSTATGRQEQTPAGLQSVPFAQPTQPIQEPDYSQIIQTQLPPIGIPGR